MITITDGTTAVNPVLRLSAISQTVSRNIVHPLLSGGVAVTLGQAALRSGTLDLFFSDATAAETCEALHIGSNVIQITDTDHAALNMTYVPTGTIVRELDERTATRWIVKIPFQEVTP